MFLGFYFSTNSARRTAEQAADYTEDQSVTVHYLPGRPERSYLIPRYSLFPGYVLILLGLLLGGEWLTPGEWLTGRVADFLVQRTHLSDDEPHRYDWETDPTDDEPAEGGEAPTEG